MSERTPDSPPGRPVHRWEALAARLGGLPFAVAAALLFLVVVGRQDRFPAADGPFILFIGSDIGRELFSGRVFHALHELFLVATPHPPLGYLPLILTLPLLPLRWAIAASSALAVGLVVEGAIRLGRPAPAWASAAMAMLGLGSGLTWWAADHYGFDLVATAVIVQALSWLHASRGLSRERASWAFGLWLGVAFMVKYTAPMVLFLPVVAVGTVALVRQRRGLLRAAVGWAAVALPFYLYNGARVLDYAGLTVAPPDIAGEFSPDVTLQDRFGGVAQLTALSALEDAIGLPGLLLCAAAALVVLRRLELLALVSGFALMSSLNVCEGRYLLPLVFLLGAAALPRALGAARGWRRVWAFALVCAGAVLGAVALHGSLGAYARTPASSVPTERVMVHSIDGILRLDGWPRPAEPFLPVSSAPERWKVGEVDRAVAALVEPYERVLLASQCLSVPDLAVFALVGISDHSFFGWAKLYLSGSEEVEVSASSTLLPGTSSRYAYVVYAPFQGSVVQRWLDARAHRVIERYELPHGCVGRLVQLDPPFYAEEGAFLWSYQPGEARAPAPPGAPPPPPPGRDP